MTHPSETPPARPLAGPDGTPGASPQDSGTGGEGPAAPLLEVRGLKVHFPVGGGWFGGAPSTIRAVDGVSFTVQPGETVGLVGESGCGKSTLGRAILRLEPITAGSVRFEGVDLAGLAGDALRAMRRRLQIIFQDPFGTLNPRMTIGQILAEPLEIHRLFPEPEARRERIAGLLRDVGLDPGAAQRYPHEFSGGQRQRIGIARALAVEPRLIVCDEPVSALDVSVQAQVVNLLADLQAARGLAYLFIAHDLAVVEHLSHRILVMYLGRIVEEGPAREICRDPLHPYSRALLSAVPEVNPTVVRQRIVLTGDLPSPLNPPPGCAFSTRCPWVEARCRSEVPELREIAPGRWAACHRVGN
jgi:oligopeptide transport system ATP-binding protein